MHRFDTEAVHDSCVAEAARFESGLPPGCEASSRE